jgi:putative membrane protein
MSVQHDQQLAGAIMKTGGGIFLWTVIIFLFFKRFAAGYYAANDGSYRRPHPIPGAELTGDRVVDSERPLTTADVERAFAQVPAASDERPS